MPHSYSAGSSPSKISYKSEKMKPSETQKLSNKEVRKRLCTAQPKTKSSNRPSTSNSPYAPQPRIRISPSKNKLRTESEDLKPKHVPRKLSKSYENNEGFLVPEKKKDNPLISSKTTRKSSEVLSQNKLNQCHANKEASSSFASECLDAIKRYASGTPRRNIRNVLNKENDKRERRSRTESPTKSACQSPKKVAKSQKQDDRPSELECIWTFEKDVMWSLNTLNNKRSGYILFNCSILDNPPLARTAAKYDMTFRFSQADSRLLRSVLESHGFTEVQNSKFNLFWGNAHFNPNEMKQLQEWQKVNHFPRSSELTRKDRLYMNIKRMQRQFGVKVFDFIPTSFVLPTEYRDFCDTYLRERGTWIVKPVASSQGKGIYLASQMDQVPSDETALVSKYVDSPLLVNGYKCDLRLYVCVTSLDPLIVYLYEEGLVRLASVKYQHGKNLGNPCIHLTNYSVNKFHSNYIQNEDPDIEDRGNKWSLSAFLKHLKSRGIDTGSLMRGIEDVILKSLLSASYQMTTATNIFVPHSRNCFEMYGFDILIDSNLKPWILEVNLSPSLNIDQPLDLKIKSSMLVDLFSLIGIQICNPNSAKYSSKHSLLRKLPNLRYSTESYEKSHFGGKTGSSDKYIPSIEELKMFKQVKEESFRSGGWARIFPTPDSWAMYGGLLEYQSPLNLILHHHLYPDIPRASRSLRVAPLRTSSVSSRGLASSLERLVCYERTLPKGFSSFKEKFKTGLGRKEEKKSAADLSNIKASLVEAMENGYIFSKYQARMTFSVYLQHIQRRLMIGSDQEKQTELVYKFLRSATRTLQLPVGVQAPSKTLPKESRAVIISKQLGDFIQEYTKETQLYFDQNASVSCSSLSSQCATSSVPTPSEPYPSLEKTSEKLPGIKTSLSAREIGTRSVSIKSTSRTLPNRLHRSRPPQMSTSTVSLACSLPDNVSSGQVLSKPSSISSVSSVSMDDKTASSKDVTLRLRSDADSGICSIGDISKSASMELTSENVSQPRRKSSQSDAITMDLYRSFLSNAKETDLEEVLSLQTRMQNSAGVFLDPPRRSRSQRAAVSAGRTPTASPHGSPRRIRRTPVAPVTMEPHANDSVKTKDDGSMPPQSSSSSCCLFGNILKASLQGTNTTLT